MANILVTGGAGGVGLTLVGKLVARGDHVVATVLNDAEAARIAEHHGDAVATHLVDMANAETALIKLRVIISAMDRLDAVAVCAAIAPNGPVEVTPLADIRTMLEINCLSGIAVFQAAMPALRKSKGRLVYVSSASGRLALPFLGPYAASKFALEGAADAMRREVHDQGVRISLVEPGAIRTEMFTNLSVIEDQLAKLNDENRARYEYLYRWFSTGVKKSLEATVLEPETVADVLIQAIDAPKPEARYPVGETTKKNLEMIRTVSDRDMDESIRKTIAEILRNAS